MKEDDVDGDGRKYEQKEEKGEWKIKKSGMKR